MCRKRDDGIGRVFAGIAKSAVPMTFEKRHAIRPHAPVTQRLTDAFWNRPEVLADYKAAMRDALLRDHRQHGLERETHVGTVGGIATLRNKEHAIETKRMINSDRAGIAHHGAQRLSQHREIGFDQALRME